MLCLKSISVENFILVLRKCPTKIFTLMSRKNRQLDFKGQNIYVGLAAHRKSFTVSIEGERLFYKTFTQPPVPEILAEHCIGIILELIFTRPMKLAFVGFGSNANLKSLGYIVS